MTKSQQWSFYLSCSLFFLLLVSIMAFGEDESIEGDSNSKRLYLGIHLRGNWLHYCQIGSFGYARHDYQS